MILIDVRTKDEWDLGKLEKAIHIPLDIIAKEITSFVNDKTAEVKLYCRSGMRSGSAKQILEQLGFTNVENIGGFESLVNQGYKAN